MTAVTARMTTRISSDDSAGEHCQSTAPLHRSIIETRRGLDIGDASVGHHLIGGIKEIHWGGHHRPSTDYPPGEPSG
jgi:hypothetical protein